MLQNVEWSEAAHERAGISDANSYTQRWDLVAVMATSSRCLGQLVFGSSNPAAV